MKDPKTGAQTKPTVWIDLENAPHVWVLSPIASYLRAAGYPLILTARDFSCTVGLCRRMGLDAEVIGGGYSKNKLAKVLKGGQRALQLYRRMHGRRAQVGLALSHGSRTQALAAHYLGMRTVALNDYEYSDQSNAPFVDHMLMPFPIPRETNGRFADRVVSYPGLKEELYLCTFQPRPTGLPEMENTGGIRVLLRPEGRFTHYRAAQSEVLQRAILGYLAQVPEIFLVLLPRDPEQGRELTSLCGQLGIRHWIPRDVLDGPSLIWEMDLVIGGGGTMTREAAALGVPSYSFFAGQWGAVDRYLQSQGRLTQLAEVGDLQQIRLEERERREPAISHTALDFVTGYIAGLLGEEVAPAAAVG